MLTKLRKIISKIPRYLYDSLKIVYWRIRSFFFTKRKYIVVHGLSAKEELKQETMGMRSSNTFANNILRKKYFISLTQHKKMIFKMLRH